MNANLSTAEGAYAGASVAQSGRTIFPGSPAMQGLASRDGVEWREFRRSLQPRFWFVWCDIGARMALLVLGYAAACAVAALAGNGVGFAFLPLAAAWIGYWFGSLVLFMHEGAHYNLHADKAVNDRLANAFICILTGDEVKHYRALHWKHHLHLGDVDDTEVSYHWAPTFRFMFETLFGIHAWRVFKAHRRARGVDTDESDSRQRDTLALARGIVLHAVLVSIALLAGWYSAAAAWVVGVAVVFPFVSALRQQLEHRAEDASSATDYSVTPHGPVNRMFEGTLFARSFGSAGFWRHLLHHWDPSVSYTRFTDFERFLMKTDLAPSVDAARTSYGKVWQVLRRG
ncbi:MAG: fatty acid desaturase [Thermodesulfobacteriota bacterium]